MKKLLFGCIAIFSIAVMSCNTNYKKTKTGMEYKIYSGKATGANTKGAKEYKPGDIVKFNFAFEVERKGKKDTTLNDSYAMMPQYVPYDTTEQILRSPFEPLMYAKVGDSILFRISVDTLVAHQLVQENDVFTKGGFVKGRLSVLDAFTSDSLAKLDFDNEVKLYEAKEDARKKTAIVEETKAVEKYLSDHKITATKTPNGAFYVIENEGTGAKLDTNKVAVVKYKGYTFDGNVFDQNIDTTGGHPATPFEVVMGTGSVVPGFEDGLFAFKKGSKGKIFIPASLGYGTRAMPNLPANSNLVFDVEIVDIKDAPSQQTGMPQLSPEQMEELQRQMQQQQNAPAGH